MTFKSLKRIAVLSALFLFSLTGLSDDTELFTGANINNNARPQVMIILDTSGSMGWDAPKADYDANTIYSGDYTSNGIHIVKFDSDLVTEGSPCNTIWVEINGKNRKRVECIGNYLNWFEQDAEL